MDSMRYFATPPLEDATLILKDGGVPLLQQHSKAEYLKLAELIAQQCWDNSPAAGSLYAGSLGPCAYLRFRMALAYEALAYNEEDNCSPDAIEYREKARSLLHTALKATDTVLQLSSRVRRQKSCTLLTGGEIGALAIKSAILQAQGDKEKSSKLADEMLELGNERATRLKPGECEVLYGRAGFLQAILFVRKYRDDASFGRETVVRVLDHIVAAGEEHSKRRKSDLPLLWEWYSTEYLGAAHGIVGILFTALQFPQELETVSNNRGQDVMLLIKKTINRLNDMHCAPSGNLHSSLGKVDDRLVHWCHGAPGHILLLCKAFTTFGDTEYLQQAEIKCSQVLFPRGLLKKGLGLCHGIGGNTYPFLAVAKISSSDKGNGALWEAKARHFANFGISKLSELSTVPDSPYSLYEGLAGFVVLLLDLQNPQTSCFPCYDF